jgi:hypothetical protein
MKYIITTGFYTSRAVTPNFVGQTGQEKADFFDIWYDNTLKYAKPEKIFIINSNAEILPKEKKGIWIDLDYNFGYPANMIGRNYLFRFNGWTVAYVCGAMLAYANGYDFIFKEQDCLAFNGWVEQLYRDLELSGKKMLIGSECSSVPGLRCEQSLTIIKHDFILDFLQERFNMPQPDGGDGHTATEWKYADIMQKRANEIGYISFGYGRTRPQNGFSPIETFYVQQTLNHEVEKLKEINLI